MKPYFFFLLFILMKITCFSQPPDKAGNIIEGSKALIELISVFKKKPAPADLSKSNVAVDSCTVKQTGDLCFKNSSLRDIVVSVYKRMEAGYEAVPFTMRVIAQRQECWYELRSGIYKYKIETDSAGIKTLFREGELKLQACDKMQKEITQ